MKSNQILASRVVAFKTYRKGTLRTVGLGVLWEAGAARISWRNRDLAVVLSTLFAAVNENLDATARGKVFFVTAKGEELGKATIESFQVKGTESSACYCGNSTAAALALTSMSLNRSSFDLQLACGNRLHRVRARVTWNAGKALVKQKWIIKDVPTIKDVTRLRMKCFEFDLFNEYLILPSESSIKESLLSKLVKLGGITQKVCVIESSTHPAKATFFNCNGKHGAAPQTGLATLAVAATKINSLQRILCDGVIQTPKGIETLPQVSEKKGELQIELPEVLVNLSQIATHP